MNVLLVAFIIKLLHYSNSHFFFYPETNSNFRWQCSDMYNPHADTIHETLTSIHQKNLKTIFITLLMCKNQTGINIQARLVYMLVIEMKSNPLTYLAMVIFIVTSYVFIDMLVIIYENFWPFVLTRYFGLCSIFASVYISLCAHVFGKGIDTFIFPQQWVNSRLDCVL